MIEQNLRSTPHDSGIQGKNLLIFMKSRSLIRYPGFLFAVLLGMGLVGLPKIGESGVIPRPSRKCKKILRNRDKPQTHFLYNKKTGASKADYLHCYSRELWRKWRGASGLRGLVGGETRKSRRIRSKIDRIEQAERILNRLRRKYRFSGKWRFTIDVAPSVWSIYTLKQSRDDLLTGTIQTSTGKMASIIGAIDRKKGKIKEFHPYPGGGECEGRIVWKSAKVIKIVCDGVSMTGRKLG